MIAAMKVGVFHLLGIRNLIKVFIKKVSGKCFFTWPSLPNDSLKCPRIIKIKLGSPSCQGYETENNDGREFLHAKVGFQSGMAYTGSRFKIRSSPSADVGKSARKQIQTTGKHFSPQQREIMATTPNSRSWKCAHNDRVLRPEDRSA